MIQGKQEWDHLRCVSGDWPSFELSDWQTWFGNSNISKAGN